uniref:Uncharacterized protein n=1 Tax=Globisporangium ultimum (strain ATCC 200006 / CBS 805.95 / DAOM BR144) TaxID=431595 RepID=K3XBF9_GLOUD
MTLLVGMMLTLSALVALELVLERDLLFASECFMMPQSQTIATYEFTFERLQQWKANWQSYTTVIQSNDTKTCSPQMVDPAKVPYLSSHRFYSTLQEMMPLAPPVFTHDAMHFCDAEGESEEAGWSYCLPITGRKDSPYCDGASRMDLLVPLTNETRCFASAVHMLLVDVYDEFRDMHRRPVLLYGSMLGAVRDGAPIPFTEDADLGYHDMTHDTATKLVERLREKGYHMFFDAIWRVCIAPNHPLALNLYDPSVGTLNGAQQAPYVDLYMLRRENASHWYADCTRDDRPIPNAKFEPYARVSLNGVAMDTLADPVDFLVHEYGDGYMIPNPR